VRCWRGASIGLLAAALLAPPAAACEPPPLPGATRIEGARHVALLAAAPRLNAVTRRAYLGLINRAPRIWSAIYAWLDRSTFFPRGLWLFRREIRILAEHLDATGPTVLCSTFPAYAFMLQSLAQRGLGFLEAHHRVAPHELRVGCAAGDQ
jgi:hypothetical protein